jgi:hypothetical protein
VHNVLVQCKIGWGGDKDVIHVDMDHPWVAELEWAQEFVHDALEGGWCIALSKVHDLGLEEPFFCLEGSLPFIALLDAHIVVPPLYVKLGEQGVTLQFTCDAFNVWEWVGIADCPGVDWSVVLDGAEGAIFLFDHKSAHGIGGVRVDNISFIKVLLDILLHCG